MAILSYWLGLWTGEANVEFISMAFGIAAYAAILHIQSRNDKWKSQIETPNKPISSLKTDETPKQVVKTASKAHRYQIGVVVVIIIMFILFYDIPLPIDPNAIINWLAIKGPKIIDFILH